jgi:hypothetical protein
MKFLLFALSIVAAQKFYAINNSLYVGGDIFPTLYNFNLGTSTYEVVHEFQGLQFQELVLVSGAAVCNGQYVTSWVNPTGTTNTQAGVLSFNFNTSEVAVVPSSSLYHAFGCFQGEIVALASSESAGWQLVQLSSTLNVTVISTIPTGSLAWAATDSAFSFNSDASQLWATFGSSELDFLEAVTLVVSTANGKLLNTINWGFDTGLGYFASPPIKNAGVLLTQPSTSTSGSIWAYPTVFNGNSASVGNGQQQDQLFTGGGPIPISWTQGVALVPTSGSNPALVVLNLATAKITKTVPISSTFGFDSPQLGGYATY